MDWKLRANLLRCLATMPGGHRLYMALQRRFGRFRNPTYIRGKFKRQAELARLGIEHGVQLDDAHVMELGTGWLPAMSIGFYLCGAEHVSTFDLNRYVQLEALQSVIEQLDITSGNQDIWADIVDLSVLVERMKTATYLGSPPNLGKSKHDRVLSNFKSFNIDYVAPGDARDSGLDTESVDIHCSTNTFEHIPREDLLAILIEARRVLKPSGLAIHYVDPTDHFAHADKTQSPVRFLNLSERDIERYYRNRYAYQNLLFDDDYRELFDEAGLEIVDVKFKIEERSLRALEANAPTLPGFENRDIEELSRRNLIYIGRRKRE